MKAKHQKVALLESAKKQMNFPESESKLSDTIWEPSWPRTCPVAGGVLGIVCGKISSIWRKLARDETLVDLESLGACWLIPAW